MPFIPITAFYTVLLAILMLVLAYLVVRERQKLKFGLGHADGTLLVAARNHANATEYIPISILLLAMAELNGASHGALHISGALLVLSRLLHAWGFRQSKGRTHFGRYWGIVINWTLILWLSAVNLLLSWRYIF